MNSCAWKILSDKLSYYWQNSNKLILTYIDWFERKNLNVRMTSAHVLQWSLCRIYRFTDFPSKPVFTAIFNKKNTRWWWHPAHAASWNSFLFDCYLLSCMRAGLTVKSGYFHSWETDQAEQIKLDISSVTSPTGIWSSVASCHYLTSPNYKLIQK